MRKNIHIGRKLFAIVLVMTLSVTSSAVSVFASAIEATPASVPEAEVSKEQKQDIPKVEQPEGVAGSANETNVESSTQTQNEESESSKKDDAEQPASQPKQPGLESSKDADTDQTTPEKDSKVSQTESEEPKQDQKEQEDEEKQQKADKEDGEKPDVDKSQEARTGAVEEVRIRTEQDLIELANRVNGGDSMQGVVVLLENDITLTKPWTPIGNTINNPFSGTFNGQKHMIRNLSVVINSKGGLFGFIVGAKISHLGLSRVFAPHSTGGFFQLALRSSVDFSSYQMNEQAPEKAFSVRFLKATDNWDGVTKDAGWRSTNVITTGAQLADFSDAVNNGDATAQTADVVLGADINMNGQTFVPIGTRTNPFKGNFSGAGHTISNMKISSSAQPGSPVGFFGYVDGKSATLSSVVLNNITVESNELITGVLVGETQNTAISDVMVVNSTIVSNIPAGIQSRSAVPIVGGIAGFMNSYVPYRASVTNSALLNTNITVEQVVDRLEIGGIVGRAAIEGIQNCVSANNTMTYNGVRKVDPNPKLEKLRPVLMAGISATLNEPHVNASGGVLETISNTSGNLVLNNTFRNADMAAGLVLPHEDRAVSIAYPVARAPFNMHISNNMVLSNAFEDCGEVFILAGFQPGSAQFNLVDQGGTYEMFNKLSDAVYSVTLFFPEFISTNYWSERGTSTYPLHSENGNEAIGMHTLTNGRWLPIKDIWTAHKGYFPQITYLTENTIANQTVTQDISGLAALALLPNEDGERWWGTLPNARGLVLPNTLPTGAEVVWTVSPNSGTYTTEEKDGFTLVATEDATANLTITATITTSLGAFHKTFSNVTIVDGVLKEDVTKRIDYGMTSPPLVALSDPLQLTFLEPIELNANARGSVELYVMRPGTDSKTLVGVVPVNTLSTQFEIDTANRVAQVYFQLEAGKQYMVRFPEGMVKEQGKKNLSQMVEVRFYTETVLPPAITITLPNGQSGFGWEEGRPLALSNLTSLVQVMYSTTDNTLLYDGSKDPTPVMQKYTGKWDDNNPSQSAAKALQELSQFPPGANTVRYYVSNEKSVLQASPKAGSYTFYVLAKNKDNKTAYKALRINISGAPIWQNNDAPAAHVHTVWSDDIDTVLTAAKQNKIAIIEKEAGLFIPAEIQTHYSEAEWQNSIAERGGPAKLEVEVRVLDQSGTVSEGATRKVTVYLDRPLAYTLTPSPVIMSYTTKEKVEEKINFVARNFSSKDIEYDHYKNDYRKPGTYDVGITTPNMPVTLCNEGKTCTAAGTHPKEAVDEYFTVQIKFPEGAEQQNYWGEVAREMEEDVYSKDLLNLKPRSYLLPAFALETLEKQNYGRMQLRYHNEYRWKIYSTSLDTTRQWSDYYSLEVQAANDNTVAELAGGDEESVQFIFENQGRLFGQAEFDLNLAKARLEHPDLPTKNLALYRYNEAQNRLEMVSDIVVEDNGVWGSAIISETLPTIYVVKAKEAGDVRYPDITGKRSKAAYYKPTKAYKEQGARTFVMDADPTLVEPSTRRFLGAAVAEVSPITKPQTSMHMVWVATGIGLALVAVVAILVYRKLHSGKEGIGDE